MLRLAPKTIDAYGRSLDDYLAFCSRSDVEADGATRDQVALYVRDLSSRPNPRGARILDIGSGSGLSNATIQLRLTAVRLYYDHLVEEGLRGDNPVGRGRYTPGKAFAGKRERGLVRQYKRLPWIPGDGEWRRVLAELREEPLRNRAMLLLAYDGALRREELVTLEVGDLHPPYRRVHLRAEATKNGAARVVGYSALTGRLLAEYARDRKRLAPRTSALFVSESHRNRACALTTSAWSKAVAGIAARAGVPRFTPHTLRHLRLTHMARAGMGIHEIATYAGHRSLQTTALYIHLSGVELAGRIATRMAGFEDTVEEALG